MKNEEINIRATSQWPTLPKECETGRCLLESPQHPSNSDIQKLFENPLAPELRVYLESVLTDLRETLL